MKRILLSALSMTVLAFGANAQTNSDITKNAPTNGNTGFVFQFMTSGTQDNNVLNCNDNGAFNVFSAAGSTFNISTAGNGQLEWTFTNAVTGSVRPANRLKSGNCTNAPINITANKTIRARVKASVAVELFLFPAADVGGQWKTLDGTGTGAYQAIAADGNFHNVTFAVSDSTWDHIYGGNNVVGYEMWLKNNSSAGTLTFEFIEFGDGLNKADLSVNEVSTVSGVSVYPSPATNNVNLKFTAQENVTVTISDITGRVMSSEVVSAGSYNKSYDVSTYAQGLYFATISGANGQTTQKFMVK